MSAQTSIQWTDRTWNPIRGCSRVSDGCRNCYAEKVAARFSGKGLAYEGLTSVHPSGERRWNGTVVRASDDVLFAPGGWKKPQRIFVNSMSDLFHEALDDDAIDDVFDIMEHVPQHTYQILTKRALRMREWVGAWRPHTEGSPSPLPNVHLGVSVENQETADDRIQWLLQTPAAVRFLSVEPLLEKVNLAVHLKRWEQPLHWVIVGGESGRGARPCDVAWIRSVVEQCKTAGVPCFVKQLGAKPHIEDELDLTDWPTASWHVCKCGQWIGTLNNRKGGDPSEWPEDLRVRTFPTPN